MTHKPSPRSYPVMIARDKNDALAALFIENAQDVLNYKKQDLCDALKLAQQIPTPDASVDAVFLEGSLMILKSHERDLASGRTTLSDYPALEKILPLATPKGPN